jgi:hypothetical protein
MAARSLGGGTVESRLLAVQRFADFTGEYPWQWGAADVDDWGVDQDRPGGPRSTGPTPEPCWPPVGPGCWPGSPKPPTASVLTENTQMLAMLRNRAPLIRLRLDTPGVYTVEMPLDPV